MKNVESSIVNVHNKEGELLASIPFALMINSKLAIQNLGPSLIETLFTRPDTKSQEKEARKKEKRQHEKETLMVYIYLMNSRNDLSASCRPWISNTAPSIV